MKIVSWNVNSLRSAEAKFLAFMETEQPDVVMLQEVRAHQNQLSFFLQNVSGYDVLFNDSGRPGYAGTAVYYTKKLQFTGITSETGNKTLDSEGRSIVAQLGNFKLVNVYVPNGNMNEVRLNYKVEFLKNLIAWVKEQTGNGFSIIIGGDLNIAHTPNDLYAPNANAKVSGFLPIERKLFDDLLATGLLDSFRLFHPDGKYFSWWSLGDKTRSQNKGWRFDYFLVSKDMQNKIKSAEILKAVFGSDHCPVLITYDQSLFP
jgi:exodeoxyribonuclease-3